MDKNGALAKTPQIGPVETGHHVDLPALSVTLSNALVTLSGSECRALQGPIVYALFRNGVAWYVGMSTRGIIRPLSLGNDGIAGFAHGDTLYVWAFGTEAEACAAEQEFIVAWNPRANKAIPTPIKAHCALCGKELIHTYTRGSAQKYCSHRCRTRAYRFRKESGNVGPNDRK